MTSLLLGLCVGLLITGLVVMLVLVYACCCAAGRADDITERMNETNIYK